MCAADRGWLPLRRGRRCATRACRPGVEIHAPEGRAETSPAPAGSSLQPRRETACAPSSLLELARLALRRARVRPSLVAEQLGLEQLLGKRGAIEGDQRSSTARRRAMQETGDDFLAGTGLAEQQKVASVDATCVACVSTCRHCADSPTTRRYPVRASNSSVNARTRASSFAARASVTARRSAIRRATRISAWRNAASELEKNTSAPATRPAVRIGTRRRDRSPIIGPRS